MTMKKNRITKSEAKTKGRIWRSKIEKQRFGEAEEGTREADPKKQMI